MHEDGAEGSRSAGAGSGLNLKQQHELRAGKFIVYAFLAANTVAILLLILLSHGGHLAMTVPRLLRHFVICQSILAVPFVLVHRYGHHPATKYVSVMFLALMYLNDVSDISVSHEVWLVAFFIVACSTLYLDQWFILYAIGVLTATQAILLAVFPAQYMPGTVGVREVVIRLAAFVFTGLVCALTTRWGADFILRTMTETHRANSDPLTGIPNRKFLLDRVADLVAQRARPVSLLMLDIDHFKRVNDSYGHQYGDFVLREVAIRVRDSIRDGDLLARYGGEEFTVVLGAGHESALAVAERIRMAVEQTQFLSGGVASRATVSIGLAVLEDSDTRETLVGRADRNLYCAKREGRNRVCDSDVAPRSARTG